MTKLTRYNQALNIMTQVYPNNRGELKFHLQNKSKFRHYLDLAVKSIKSLVFKKQIKMSPSVVTHRSHDFSVLRKVK